jgi:hypothetical protein
MTSKQLGTLLRKAPPATVTEPEAPSVPTAVPNTASAPGTAREERSREVPLHVLVPAHVRKQVDILGAQQGESLRTLVLRGLRSIGIEVSDEEIRGGHKRERRQ